MGVVADRTCPSCGADVSSASGFCPRCGADLEARLIELGGGTPAGARRTPRRDRPRRARLLAGVAAVVVGGLAVTTLVGDDGDDGGGDGGPGGDGGTPDATTTTLGDLSDRAPLLGEETGLLVAIGGQANVLVDLDGGQIVDLAPFRPSGAVDDAFVVTSELGVQLWESPYEESAAFLLDDLGASQAVLGSSVAWAVDDGEARALRRDESGELFALPLPSGAAPAGTVGDSLVLAAPGGTFTVSSDGITRHVADGTAVAAEHGFLVLTSCDDALVCVVQTTDAEGRVLQTVPLSGAEPVTAAAVGPDGQAAWISGAPGNGFVFVDGRERFPLPSAGAATLDWSPDGRWLIGSFGRDDIWVLDAQAGPDAAPEIVDLGRNVYPTQVFVVAR
jgi:hypothetical protein